MIQRIYHPVVEVIYWSCAMRRALTSSTAVIAVALVAMLSSTAPVVAQDVDAAAILADLGEGYEAADLTNGARQYRRCQACHTLDEGGANRSGPNLHGIMFTPAAQVDGFSYSSALVEAGLVWDVETLDAWLENPRTLVPRNRMSFAGLRDADARRDLIGYMAVESSR
jgi:cytochrome c